MNKKTKIIWFISLFAFQVLLKAQMNPFGSVSGSLIDNNRENGKYWVWLSSEPLIEPFANNITSHTSVPVNYKFNMVPLETPLYINAVKDINPPYIEDYLLNPQPNLNPISGDPVISTGPIILTLENSNIQGINLILPSNKIEGIVHYYGEVLEGQKLEIYVVNNPPYSGIQPVAFSEFPITTMVTTYYYQIKYNVYLPDGDNYYVIAKTNYEPNAGGIIGPIKVSNGQQVSNINFGNIRGTISYSGDIRMADESNNILKIAISKTSLRGYDFNNEAVVCYREIYSVYNFPYDYVINFVPAGSHYVIAMLDDNNPYTNDPYAQIGPMDTLGVGLSNVNFSLIQPIPSTMTATLDITVTDDNYLPVETATVKLYYTNDTRYNYDDDILVETAQTDLNGNVVLTPTVFVGKEYYIIVEKQGYVTTTYPNEQPLRFSSPEPVQVQIALYQLKVGVQLQDLSFIPSNRKISPDDDNVNDQLKVNFTVKFLTSDVNKIYDAAVTLMVDVNKNGVFDPIDWNQFFFDNQGRIFVKKNLNTYIDQNNPDYSQLIGPISQDEYNRIISQYDVKFSYWLSRYNFTLDQNNNLSSSGEITWDGRNNAYALLPNGTYTVWVKSEVYNGVTTTLIGFSSTTVTIETAGIKGRVVDANNNPISGAKISCSGPNIWQQVFTDENGNFSISGLKSGDSYHIEIEKEGYVKEVRDNVQAGIPEKDIGTIQLQKGITISGNIILPNPPLAGSIKDQWGGYIYDLWIHIEAQNLSGGEWLWKDMPVRLPDVVLTSTSVPYSLSVAPNTKYRIVARTVGYVSKDVEVSVGTTDLTQNIELTKAVRAKGYVKLPSDATEFNTLKEAVGGEGFGINIWARSKDGKYNSWANTWYSDFELQPDFQKQFYVESLVPNTSYYIGIEGTGFARQQKEVYITSEDTYIGEFTLSAGTKISGTMNFGDGLYELLQNDFREYNGQKGIWIGVDVNDTNYRWVTGTGGLFISSSVIAAKQPYQFTIYGLENNKKYLFRVWVEREEKLEITPAKNFELTVTTSTTLNITFSVPTGVVKGKLVNQTGTNIDLSKVTIIGVVFDGGEFKPANVSSDGEFILTGMKTGEGILWGGYYEKQNDLPTQVNIFGTPSDKTQLFFKRFYSVSGSTVNVGEITLRKPGKIEVIVKGEPSNIGYIYEKELELFSYLSLPNVHPGGPWGLVRVQSAWLKVLAEQLIKLDPQSKTKKEEVSIGLDLTVSSQTIYDTTALLKYTFNAAEEGYWDVYFAYGDLPIVRGWEKTPNGGEEKVIYNTEFPVSPVKQSVYVKPGETKQVVFELVTPVKVEGVITRPQAGVEETIVVNLKDKYTGKTAASANVEFTSDKKTLNSLPFKLENVIPGEYLLVVLSPNYKVYSKEVKIVSGYASITLPAIMLSKGANITGQLVDEKGTPVVSGVFVECFADPYVEGSYRNTDMEGNYVSSDTGRFVLRNLPKGNYIIRIVNKEGSYTNYATLVKSGVSVPDTQGDVDIGVLQLKYAVNITGVVKDSSGNVLPNIPVVVYPQDIQLRRGYSQLVTTNKDGIFVFKGINKDIKYWELVANVRPEDPNKVTFEQLKYTEVVKSYINVTKEEYRNNIEIILPIADATIVGKITTSDGGQLSLPFKPEGVDIENYPAALILLQSEKDKLSQDPIAGMKVLSDPEGNFVIKGITKGKYTLKILAKGYSMAIREIEVVSGENNLDTITLQRGYRLSGTITTSTGGKVSSKLVNKIAATTRNYSDIVIGQVNYNPITFEVIDYYIDGLKPNMTYYITLVPENADGPAAISIVPEPVVVTTNTVKDIVYTKPKPYIELKSFKYKNINKDYLLICEKFVKEEIDGWTLLTQINQKDYSLNELPKHLFIALLLQDKNIFILPNNFDIFFIYGFVSHPITATSVEQLVSLKTGEGILIPVSLSESKQQFAMCYVADGNDIIQGYFELNLSVANYYGETTQANYKIYLGEDARVEKVVTPLLGGGTIIGERDNSSVEIPPGTEFENIDGVSPVNIVVKKLEANTLSTASKLSPKMFSSKVPSTEYPGELVSSIYDIEIKLISGPLVTLAKNNKIKLAIQISSSTVSIEDISKLKLGHYNELAGKWEIDEQIPTEVDLVNGVVKAEVPHLSKFAVFKVIKSTTTQPYSGEFYTYIYPNPIKNADKFGIKVALPGNGEKIKAEIKIYNLAGELVRTIEQELDAGYINDITDIEIANDKGEKLASGIYFYYIKVGDYKKLYKFAIVK